MSESAIVRLEQALSRQSVLFLFLAVLYGIGVGAVITMYYEVVPNMDSIEDILALVQIFLYLIGVIFSFVHVPRILWNLQNRKWNPAFLQMGLGLGPLLIFVGSEGLVSHVLSWQPLSDTDRFHMLHHTLFAGVPLLFLYWLALRRWWAPSTHQDIPNIKKLLVTSALIALVFSLGFGVMFGTLGMMLLVFAGLLVSARKILKSYEGPISD